MLGRPATEFVGSREFQRLYGLLDNDEFVERIRGTSYLDVARRGEDPGVHFLRHWDHPFRKPSEAFDIAQYVLDHPEVLELGVNPLVHFLLSPEGRSATRYPPER